MHGHRHLRISKNRLETLVDGIFAFAMTLLVTGLVIPRLLKTEADVMFAGSLAAMRPKFISFLVAFFVLASFWMRHNQQFHHLRHVDGSIMRLTLLALAGVIMLPFTTSISGDYSHIQLAVNLFHANMFGLGMIFFIQWRHMTKHPGITSAAITGDEAVTGMLGSLMTPAVSAAGSAFSFLSPSWSMAVYLLMIPCGIALKQYARQKNKDEV